MNDTPKSVTKRISEMLASRTSAERLKMASGMFESGKKLLRAGLLQENKNLTEMQLREKIFTRLYGEDFSNKEIHQIFRAIAHKDK